SMGGNITLKPQPMNEEYEFEEYTARAETVEGLVFLHLDVDVWNKSTLRKLRDHLDDFLKRAEGKGHDVVFLTSYYEKCVKSWNLIKPLYEVQEIEKNGTHFYLGAWITGEDEWA